MLLFQELAISVTKLGDRVAPWLKIRLGSEPSVSKIITALDKLVYDDGISKDKVGCTSNCKVFFKKDISGIL